MEVEGKRELIRSSDEDGKESGNQVWEREGFKELEGEWKLVGCISGEYLQACGRGGCIGSIRVTQAKIPTAERYRKECGHLP